MCVILGRVGNLSDWQLLSASRRAALRKPSKPTARAIADPHLSPFPIPLNHHLPPRSHGKVSHTGVTGVRREYNGRTV